MKDIIPNITMKELERLTFRVLQESFTQVMGDILTRIDDLLCEHRDKTRFRYIDKRELQFESMFGRIELKRRYYKDRAKGEYVSLLEHYLEFDGSKGMSPVVQDLAMELAVTGVSYRQASKALEKLLGYQVISHEAIRQQVLNTEVMPKEPESIDQEVLFVEVDGLYTKSQGKKKKGREIKIASVHQGWEVNGKRSSLIKKRHFIHQGTLPFWEEFEDFLMNHYEYDPTKHHLVINGDGAPWITACREYFRHNVTFVIDRFHIARDVQRIFRDHPHYRTIRKRLATYDVDGFMVELNSAVGTLEHEKKEERLEALIAQLSQYPEALGDYREKLKDSAAEAVRNNIAYLQRAIGKPIVTALKELRGI